MTASPANFSTMPPCVVMQCETCSKYGLDAAAHDLGIARRDERRRVDEIDEQDGCELAFHAVKCRNDPEARCRCPRLRSSIRRVLDPKVFKAYDVRGIYGAELDEEGAYAIGRAFVEVFEPKRIAVGHDMRVSSPSMAEAVIEGAAEAGADVLELGLVGTEMVYFAVGELGLDGGDRGHRLAQPEGVHRA